MSTKHLAASISAALALLVAGLMADAPSVRAAFLPGPPGGVLSGGDGEDESEVDEESDSGAPTLLTPEQINRIRYMELRAMRDPDAKFPDPVTVKISVDTIEEFLKSMEGDLIFEGRRKFMKLTPAQKLHQIAYYKGTEYADKVKIKSDPAVFKDFKRNVMPKVLRTCATVGCHTTASRENVGLRLYKDPKRSNSTTYTNFVTLNDYTFGEEDDPLSLINRDLPDESMLLSYMLRKEEVIAGERHPGNVKYRAAFQSRGVIGYKNILRWIRSLKHPAEDYGLHPQEDDEDRDEGSEMESGDDGKRQKTDRPSKPRR